MNTRDKTLFTLFLLAGILLIGAGYYFLLHDGGSSYDDTDFENLGPVVSTEADGEPEIIPDIEGFDPELVEEALPDQGSKDVGAITGWVQSKDKKPIPDARVFLFRSKSPITALTGKLKPLYTTKTDKEGCYKFQPLYVGRGYRLVAEHDEYMSETMSNITVESTEDTQAPLLVLHPGKTVFGKVRDHKSRPIAGALVELYDPMSLAAINSRNATPRQQVRTNEEGKYTLPQVKDVNFLVRASAPGFEKKIDRNEDVFTSKNRMEFNFILNKEKTIEGQVLDEMNKPIPGALIYATPMRTKHRTTISTTADEKGRFKFRGLSDGVFYVSAAHDRYSTESKPNMPSGQKDLQFRLKLRSGISGQVVDENGDPVAQSFWINLRLTSPRPDGYVPQTMKKKFKHKDGRFNFEGVEPGTYFLEVISTGFAPFKTEDIKVKRVVFTSELRIQLDRGGSISGNLLNANGTPLAGAKVQLRRNSYRPNPVEHYFGASTDIRNSPVKTNSEGQFKIELIPEGIYQLQFTHKNYPSHLIQDIMVARNEDTVLADQYMKQGATLQGKVYNDANSPLAGVKVNVRNQNNTVNLETTTNSKGFYKITSLPPGKYDVAPFRKLKPDESPFVLIGSIQNNEIKDVELVEGQVRDLNIIIYS